jgi:hypothetical protein
MTPRATERPSGTLEDARRMGRAAIGDAGRVRALEVLRRGGTRVARLDRGTVSHRALVQAVTRAMPRRFDSSAAGDLDATFELRLRDPRGGEPDRFELKISGGSCELRPGAATNPAVTVTVGADDAVLLASGAVGWPELLSNGRLVLGGDPFLAIRFPKLFRLPAAPTG